MTEPIADFGVPGQPTRVIDGYGRSYIKDLTVSAGGWNWRYVFEEQRKAGLEAHWGLYLDRGLQLSGAILRYPRDRRLFVLVESPNEPHYALLPAMESQARLVLTLEQRLLARGGRYRRLDYGTGWVNGGWPIDAPEKDRLTSFVGSVQHADEFGYRLRREVAESLRARKDVDCFGRGLREMVDKTEGLARYAFSVCMENTRANYYYTEKLIDCFLTETVPLYWGCPAIAEIFDTRGMIVFETLEELQRLIPELTWERYQQMRPYVLENQRRVAALRLADYRGHYERLSELLVHELPVVPPVPRWQRTRVAAGWRYLCQRCQEIVPAKRQMA